ncbi:hypothetical protein [Thalassospira sp. MCCC 1A01428]|uniref:hypothetical protein n=1 Tax=Thalassospira sp. MCCC 1A01428 TaxID=1470575 RepID=UPI000A1F5FB5|nr:hypothetical protein [Thalassospira sp. MCCC 1A01428]OSQ33552.1 hypothetical protein THS27_26095 [Thalassospira sp. MCCC 1A01428]
MLKSKKSGFGITLKKYFNVSQFEGISHPSRDIVDVEQYEFGRLKMAFGLAGISGWIQTIRLVVIPYFAGNLEWIDNYLGMVGRGYLWGTDIGWKKSYLYDCLRDHFLSCTDTTTPLEYVAIQFYAEPMRYILTPVGALIMLTILVAYFFIRRPAPFRVNRKLDAIYGWDLGELWLSPASEFDFSYKGEWDPLSFRFFTSGPMVVRLKNAKNPNKTRKFKLGGYPHWDRLHGRVLGKATTAFLKTSRTPDIIENAPKRLPLAWWKWAIFPVAKLPDDIDAHAEEWLRKYKYL